MLLRRYLILITIQLLSWGNSTLGHGRLEEPPSRSTMWRFGFDNPRNYNDHELYCGGLNRQLRNGGRCGVCGDPWDSPTPRANEDGGKYGRGIVVRRYSPGQIIDVIVDITANHNGYFEFKLCPVSKQFPVDDDCMDKNPLKLADGSGDRYFLPANSKNQKFPLKLALPKGLTCNRCVFQWTYTAGNNWGTCKDGTQRVGCGPQETFRACADVSIGNEFNDIEGNVVADSPITNQDKNSHHIVPSDNNGGFKNFNAWIVTSLLIPFAILLTVLS